MDDCRNAQPSERPSFQIVLQRLEALLTDTRISTNRGGSFIDRRGGSFTDRGSRGSRKEGGSSQGRFSEPDRTSSVDRLLQPLMSRPVLASADESLN